MKLIKSLVTIFLLLCLPLSIFAKYQNDNNFDKLKEEKVKQFVVKQKDASRLRVKLKNGSYYVGYLVAFSDQDFTINTTNCGHTHLQYSEVAKIQSGYSKTEKLKIGLLSPVYTGAIIVYFIAYSFSSAP